MPLSATSLFLAVIFGSLGFAYLYYGRRQRSVAPSACGLLLLIVPYFLLARPGLLLAIGCALAALPLLLRR